MTGTKTGEQWGQGMRSMRGIRYKVFHVGTFTALYATTRPYGSGSGQGDLSYGRTRKK